MAVLLAGTGVGVDNGATVGEAVWQSKLIEWIVNEHGGEAGFAG